MPSTPPAPIPRPALTVAPFEILGRQQLLERLDGLASEGARLVTLTGPPGVGKSRVAEVWSRAVAAREGRALHRLALGATRGADDLAAYVSSALEVAPVGLATSLATRGPMLLVFDDADHVHDALAALCIALLDAAPETLLVVTSRVRLGLRREVVVNVAPLDDEDARRLFVSRSYALTGAPFAPGDDDVISALVAASGRVPLAIEALAARASVFSLAAVRAEASARLGRLAVGLRDAAPHQTNLDSAVGWSLELLSPEEQRALRDIAEIPGSFDLDAAHAVIAPPDAGDGGFVADVLHRLCDRSFVRLLPQARFRVVRAVAEVVRRREDAPEARARCVAHYRRLADRWRSQVPTRDAALIDHDNVLFAERARCAGCETRSSCERAASPTSPLWWDVLGHDCATVDPGSVCALRADGAEPDATECAEACAVHARAASLLARVRLPCAAFDAPRGGAEAREAALAPTDGGDGSAAGDAGGLTLVVARDGSRFHLDGKVVDLSSHRTLSGVLRTLTVERLSEPGRAVPTDALLARVWGDEGQSRSGTSRLYVAVAKLRRMGLEGYLIRGRGGYRLNPAVPVTWSTEDGRSAGERP